MPALGSVRGKRGAVPLNNNQSENSKPVWGQSELHPLHGVHLLLPQRGHRVQQKEQEKPHGIILWKRWKESRRTCREETRWKYRILIRIYTYRTKTRQLGHRVIKETKVSDRNHLLEFGRRCWRTKQWEPYTYPGDLHSQSVIRNMMKSYTAGLSLGAVLVPLIMRVDHPKK